MSSITGSDTLWFSGWMPTSSGATAGAALGLAALSIFYRFVIAFRATLERSWRLQLTHDRVEVSLGSNGMVVPVLRRGGSPSGSSDELIKDAEAEELPALHRTPKKAFIAARRLAPPFAFSRELTRGVLQAFSSFIGYLLMLAVSIFLYSTEKFVSARVADVARPDPGYDSQRILLHRRRSGARRRRVPLWQIRCTRGPLDSSSLLHRNTCVESCSLVLRNALVFSRSCSLLLV